MEITVKNKDNGETYKTKSVQSLNALKDEYGKYFSNSDINKIIAAHEVNLPDLYFETAKAFDAKHDYIIEDRPEQKSVSTRWQDAPATQSQYDYIELLGYTVEQNLTKGQASKVIDMIKSGEASAINLFKNDIQPTNEVYGDFG